MIYKFNEVSSIRGALRTADRNSGPHPNSPLNSRWGVDPLRCGEGRRVVPAGVRPRRKNSNPQSHSPHQKRDTPPCLAGRGRGWGAGINTIPPIPLLRRSGIQTYTIEIIKKPRQNEQESSSIRNYGIKILKSQLKSRQSPKFNTNFSRI